MASIWTNKGKYRLALSGISGKTFKLLLVNATGAAVADATKKDYNTVSQVVANELAGTGYLRQTLVNVTVTEDDTNDYAVIDADDPATYLSISAGTISGGYLYEVIDSTDANDLVWGFVDLSPDIVTNGSDVSISWPVGGISTVA